MFVKKRNGALEEVQLSKIEASLKRYCSDLPNVDVYRIASKTVGGLVDGVSTLELDMLSVRTAKDLIIDDPIYSKVAARILANIIQKEVASLDIQSFSQSIEMGLKEGLIGEAAYALVMANKRKLNAAIRHERDWNLEYHGLQTVYDRYLLKHPTTLRPDGGGQKLRAVIETPQYFFMRVACGLAEDAFEAIELYGLLSSLEYMTSTPTLFNSGTVHMQCSSCFLLDSPLDSLEDIYKRYSDIALLSKFAGGIGVSMSRIRGRGALIKGTNGKSNGLVPWAHTLSASVASVNQCLHPETRVQTADGAKAIKDIVAGEDRVHTMSGEYRVVYEVLKYTSSSERMIEIKLEDEAETVRITDGHPVYAIKWLGVEMPGMWIEAGHLEVGDYLVSKPHNRRIESITTISTPDEVYDLRIDDERLEPNHNYVVLPGVICHNGGKRKGAAAVYLEPHHPDIMQFLELKDNTGEREQRAYNLNLALWISDLFMKRVKADEIWSLFDPTVAPELVDLYGDAYEKRYLELEAEGKFTEQLSARKVYARAARTLAETGNGWMCFKDTSNRRGNQVNDEAGTIIHLSNLCVAPETMLLTDQGHIPIQKLRDEQVNVWNGQQFSPVVVRQTGTDQPLVRVALTNGATLDCTPYHKFYVHRDARGYSKNIIEKRASDLVSGDRLLKSDFPVIERPDAVDFEHAYTHGVFCGDGTYNANGTPRVSLYAEKKQLVPHLDIRSGSDREDRSGRLNYQLPLQLQRKFEVPTANHTLYSRLEWFAGLLDTDGTVARNGTNEALQVPSIHPCFLENIRLMLQTMGIDAKVTKLHDGGSVQVRVTEKVYTTQPLFRLLIASVDTQKLLTMGLRCRRLKLARRAPNRSASHFTRVVTVIDNGRRDDTYCVTEPKRHMAVFNGVLTGQCTEILEVTSSGRRELVSRNTLNELSGEDMRLRRINIIGFDGGKDAFEVVTDEECAVCNLGSVNIGRGYVKHGRLDKEKLRKNVAIAVKYLDRVIDRNFYPVDQAQSSNLRWRPVGLGLMGFADFLMQLRIPFESQQAVQLSAEIQEEIYYQALKTSCELAQTLGKHRDFHLTRAAKGDLQFDLAGVTPADTARWDGLKAEIMDHGLRNSLLIAIAPTACQVATNVIRTANDGMLSLYDILDANGVPHAEIEDNNEQTWIPIKPLLVDTLDGPKLSDKIWFNGKQPTYEVTYEDGTSYEYTGNHELLVERDGVRVWTKVVDLRPDDDIVTI